MNWYILPDYALTSLPETAHSVQNGSGERTELSIFSIT